MLDFVEVSAIEKCSEGEVFIQLTNFNCLNANPTKWSNTLKQFVSNFPTNCLSVFGYFVVLAFKELRFYCKKNMKLKTDMQKQRVYIRNKKS